MAYDHFVTPADVLPRNLRTELQRSSEGSRMLSNLEAEDRLLPAAIEEFRLALVASGDLSTACRKAGRLLPCGDRARVTTSQGIWYNNVDHKRFRRAGLDDTSFAASAGPPEAPADYFQFSPGNPRSLWISTFTSSSADEVVRQLGLAFFRERWAMVSLEVRVDDSQTALFTPTVLDAEANWYWRRPPSTHTEPWGLTLDLETCLPAQPELIATVPPAVRPLHPIGQTTKAPSKACLGGGAL